MIDCHVHIERGEYSLASISEFVKVAVVEGLDEIWLLEHCYRFREFVPMYGGVCAYSDYIDKWFHRKAGVLALGDYLRLVELVRGREWPVKIKFGLEICYFEEFEELVCRETKNAGLDFLVGSVHFVDDFAFDHKAEHWAGVDVDAVYRRYFETSIRLAQSGLYTGIAHPDVIKLFGYTPSFSLEKAYCDLAAALAKNDMYAEQNSGAYRRGPKTAGLGMEEGLLGELKKNGVNIRTASDAHCPTEVGAQIKAMQAIINP